MLNQLHYENLGRRSTARDPHSRYAFQEERVQSLNAINQNGFPAARIACDLDEPA